MSMSQSDADVMAAFDGAQDALNKMARACKRGTGCHLTADEIQSLSLSIIGELWSQDDPRNTAPTGEKS